MGQHWTPRHLLHGFSPDGKNVWMYDKRSVECPKLVAISRAAQSSKAYEPPVERVMASIEHAAMPAIHAFREATLPIAMSYHAKLVLSYYLAMFVWHRNPAIRDQQVESMDVSVISAHMARMKNDYDGLPVGRLIDQLEDTVIDRWVSRPNTVFSDLWAPSAITRLLFHKMTWVILESTEGEFTIPDTTMTRSATGAGLLDQSAEFYLPLSKRRALLASWKGGPPSVVQFFHVDRDHVHSINKRGFEQAGRFVYACTHDDALRRAIKKRVQHYARVKGIRPAGQNPSYGQLTLVKENYRTLHDALCLAAPVDILEHDWHTPVEFPLVADLPDFKVPTTICKWCGCIKVQHHNGKTKYRNSEVQLVDAPVKNWWQRLKLTAESGRVVAMDRSDTV